MISRSTWLGILGVCAGLVLGAPAQGAAQREPVLKQIRVPHPYYFREMYLPQPTSGPSAAAWSPDGTELVYSMQGSLWRQRLGATEARQLTSGPGYDYQPDWSPDGKTVVYASYRNDAIELRLLDVASGRDTALLADSAVNVEPRWSPDGRRLAWVSTAYQGRFHIFTAAVADGRMGAIARLTEDHDSGLPRYYYGAFDQYLSPTWSPDGSEILLLSNRGHIWGSGGFWRMPSTPGAAMHEVRFEETNWKARPDWSRDGRRVVYSSYLGRQWNQLWLMTADGGDPFQLTYGEFDATAPRWSPDGRRVVYVSNEGGNTSLWTVTVPGGARQRVEIRRRVYRDRVGTLRLTVVDAATGRPLPARISVTGADGRSWAPDDAWRHSDDGFDRRERRFEVGYFHSSGVATLTVPADSITIDVTHGLEYRLARRRVAVPAGGVVPVRVALERMIDLPARGWYSGDLHVHMNYGGTYRATPRTLRAQAEAEDLHVVENLIVNKEGRMPDIGYFTGRIDPVSTPTTIIAHNQEFHTSFWGHLGLLGLRDHIILPGYAAYVNTPAASLFPDNAEVSALGRAQGALAGYVHPFDAMPDPANRARPLTNEFPVDVALGRVDYYEAVGFVDSYDATQQVWYRALNCGFRLPAGAGTDAMTNFASLHGPVGMSRVFVRTAGPLTQRSFLDGLKAGRTFATNGPLLEFSLGGRQIGGEVRLPTGRHALRVHAAMRSYVPVDRLELIGNGKVVASFGLTADGTHAAVDTVLMVERSGWYLLRAWTDEARYPVLDLQPIATTSPIYVAVGGEPVRSAEDAAWFITWIDRLQEAAAAHGGWNNDEEKVAVLGDIAAARAEFERRRAEAGPVSSR